MVGNMDFHTVPKYCAPPWPSESTDDPRHQGCFGMGWIPAGIPTEFQINNTKTPKTAIRWHWSRNLYICKILHWRYQRMHHSQISCMVFHVHETSNYGCSWLKTCYWFHMHRFQIDDCSATSRGRSQFLPASSIATSCLYPEIQEHVSPLNKIFGNLRWRWWIPKDSNEWTPLCQLVSKLSHSLDQKLSNYVSDCWNIHYFLWKFRSFSTSKGSTLRHLPSMWYK